MLKFFSMCFILVFLIPSAQGHDVDPLDIDGSTGGYDYTPFKYNSIYFDQDGIKALEKICELYEFQEGKFLSIKDSNLDILDRLDRQIDNSPLCFVPISRILYKALINAHYKKGEKDEYFTYRFENEKLEKVFHIDLCAYSIGLHCYVSCSQEAIGLCREFISTLSKEEIKDIEEGKHSIFWGRTEWVNLLLKDKQKKWENIQQKMEELRINNNKDLINLKKLNNNRRRFLK